MAARDCHRKRHLERATEGYEYEARIPLTISVAATTIATHSDNFQDAKNEKKHQDDKDDDDDDDV